MEFSLVLKNLPREAIFDEEEEKKPPTEKFVDEHERERKTFKYSSKTLIATYKQIGTRVHRRTQTDIPHIRIHPEFFQLKAIFIAVESIRLSFLKIIKRLARR